MNKAVIYNRISSKNQAQLNGVHISLENQLNHCKEYCEKNNFEIIATFSEIKSAKNIKFQKKLLDIYKNYDNINLIIYNITRFSRNTIEGLNFINNCKNKNIKLHFVEENLSGDQYIDQHRLRIGLSQAELESNNISQKQLKTNKVLRSKGWKFGNAKYGHHITFKNGIRSTKSNKCEQNVIKFIETAKTTTSCKELNKFLNIILPNNKYPLEFYDKDDSKIDHFSKPNTLTFQEIANILNEYGIKPRKNIWTKNKISNIYRSNSLVNVINSINI